MSIPKKHSLAEKIALYIINTYIERGIFESKERYSFLNKVQRYLKRAVEEIEKVKDEEIFKITLMNKADQFCVQLALYKYQFVADILIRRYIRTNDFTADTKEAIWNHIYGLAVHRETVKKYKGKNDATFKTYFWVCVENFLKEKHRNENKKQQSKPKKNDIDSEAQKVYENARTLAYISPNNRAILENIENIPAAATYVTASSQRTEMIETIEALIMLDGSLTLEKRKKLKLCLMIEMNLILHKRDIYAFWKKCPKKHLKMMLDNFGKDYYHLSKSEIMKYLTLFINAYQQQNNGDDALRMWLDRRKKVLSHLTKKGYL